VPQEPRSLLAAGGDPESPPRRFSAAGPICPASTRARQVAQN